MCLKRAHSVCASQPFLLILGVAISVMFAGRAQAQNPTLNLARYQPVTCPRPYQQDEGVDGIVTATSFWRSDTAQWSPSYEVDLQGTFSIRSAQIFTGTDTQAANANIRIEYWDGGAWVTCPGADITGNTAKDLNIIFSSSVTASRFRAVFTGANDKVWLREFALYPDNGGSGYPLGTDLNLNLASHAGIDASNFAAGNYPKYAVDGYINAGAQYVTDGSAGPHTLDTKMLWTQNVASVHVHSGSGPESALSDFDLFYWDGAAWQPCPGGSVTGNTDEHRIVNLSSAVNTSRIRISFSGAGHIDEIVVLPDNGGTNYPANTSVATGAPPTNEWMIYEDSWYELVNRSNSKGLTATAAGASQDSGSATGDEKSYQLLYNYDTRDYRIRNKDTGDCLAVADASTTVGATVIETTYSAAVHHRWTLEDAGAGYIRIVNRRSGLALASDGGDPAVVTQQTVAADALQEWQPVYLIYYQKKGSAGTSNGGALKDSWNYGWTTDVNDFGKDCVDYPMQWGEKASEPHTDLHRDYNKWNSTGSSLMLMAYNEPTHTDQANLTVEQGAEYFPILEQMDLPLVGPSMANSGYGPGQWHDLWYNQHMKPQGYDFEYLGLHVYKNPSADLWISIIQDFSQRFDNKKVIVSEMNAAWGSGTWTEEDVYNTWAEFMYRAESLDYLKGYAMFMFGDRPYLTSPWEVGTAMGNAYISGQLTALGNLYKAWDCDLNVYTNKAYILHNLGCGSRVANVDSDATPDGLPIRMAGDPLTQYHSANVQWALFNAPGGKYYIVSTVDGMRLSYDGATVSLAPADTYGPDVEWTLTEYRYGEYFIESHVHNYDRLRLNRTSTSPLTYVVDTSPQSDTSSSVRFRFILSVDPATVPPENPPPPRGDTDAAKSQVKLPAIVQKGTWVTATILAADSSGTLHKSGGAATWTVDVTGTNAAGFLDVTDHGDGSYTATYFATRNGTDTIDIKLNGADVGTGNPYTVTVQDEPAPILTTLPAIVMTSTEARLNAVLDVDGTANVTFFWGDTDGGITPGSWDNSIDLGTKFSGNLSYDATGLTPSSTSYFTCRATNANGTVWGMAQSFSTALTYNELLDTVDINYNNSTWSAGRLPISSDYLLSNAGARLEVDWDHLYGWSFTINNKYTRFRSEGGNVTPGWIHIGGPAGIIWNGTENLWTAFDAWGSAVGNKLYVECFAFNNNNTGPDPVLFRTAADDIIYLQLDTIGSGGTIVFNGKAGSSGYRMTGEVHVTNTVGDIGTGDGFASFWDIQTTGSIAPSGSIFVRDGTIDVNASNVIGDDVAISLEDAAGTDGTFDISGATDNVGDLRCVGSGGTLAVDGTTNYVFGDYNEGPVAITGFVQGSTVIQFDGVAGTESLANMTINGGPATWSDIGGGIFQLGTTTNWAPSVNAVTMSGSTSIGSTLTGNYAYNDTEADPDASTFQWYRSTDGVFDTNDTAIAGATGTTYVLQVEDVGCYLFFEVTPKASSGTTPGLSVLSVASDIIETSPPIADVSLPAGISLYGYTGENPMDAQAAFQTLINNDQLSLLRWVSPSGTIKELYYTTFPSAGWVNEIGNLNLGQGYVVKTKAACTLSITGNKSTTPVTHNLPVGYSIVGYNQETPRDAQEAFQPLIDAGKLELVRWVDPSNGQIKELYFTTYPSEKWVNEIGNLTEGQGYIIKLSAGESNFLLQ